MNREIEFRAWDEEEMVLLEISELSFYKGKICQIECTVDDCKKCIEVDHTILMRYTGLKDKNDKKIFEDDLLRVKYKIGNEVLFVDSLFKVVLYKYRGVGIHHIKSMSPDSMLPICPELSFESGALGIDYRNDKLSNLIVSDTLIYNIHFGNHYSNDIEIIGNIYENPELFGENE